MLIAHLADVHLDRPFVGLPPAAARRRREQLLDAFKRCLELADERDADLVTIAGDLWEEEHVRADTRASVAYELKCLARPTLIVCGNHDPLLPGGSYRRTDWPPNVEIVQLRSLHEHRYGDVSVWGVSWGDQPLRRQLLERFEVPDDGRTHLLLVHGTSVRAPFAEEAGDYFTFDPQAVATAGFELCLAGHIHMASCAYRVVYPGSPEPLRRGERGRHCAAIVQVEAGCAEVELVDVNRTRYDDRVVDCSACASSAEIEDRLDAALGDADAGDVFLRVRLVGEVDPNCDTSTARLVARHGSRYAGLLVEDTTNPLPDLERRSERKGLDGLFIRRLKQRLDAAESDRERRIVELALQAGIRAIDRRDTILDVD